ncbi:ras-related protein Rab-22A-like isoform X1 [Pomacea canaliculata]|uniref:ras-related protein Rab-22A-like isoform X1 n=1 Tax=Pomacea canaliculata TaxID=400727 RepID=UPI000D72F35F|nr:ras-related protein Rab-22A-like isoform X1 [Pomacea canaliculata]XP_025115408.1 ras-related protein Rab-22A-like isoform X1 [Pomacea canaliculata]XP_025115410.1 ras-related protein Rab-22A-like isoform X1 [Pomacea canaliculata]
MAQRSRGDDPEAEIRTMQMRDVKVCLLGDSGVGKSSIVMRFVSNTYKPSLESTIGSANLYKRVFANRMWYGFQLWDTAGDEKYRALAPMYYRGAAAAVIVYDTTREVTYRAVKSWVNELRSYGPPKIVIAIAGNKCDLEDLREVNRKDAEDYARSISAIFCETSAVTAINVEDLFMAVARQLPLEDFSDGDRRNGSTVNLRSSPEQRKKQCCSGGKNSPSSSSTSRPQSSRQS